MLTVMNQFMNLYAFNKRAVVVAIVLMITMIVLSMFLMQYGVAFAGPATSDSYCSC